MPSTISLHTLTGGGKGFGSRPRMYPKSTDSARKACGAIFNLHTYRGRSVLRPYYQNGFIPYRYKLTVGCNKKVVQMTIAHA